METEMVRTIPVVFDAAAAIGRTDDFGEATLGTRSTAARAGRFIKDVPVDQLQRKLKDLTAALGELLTDVKAVGGFELSEVQIGVELTAEGGVNLIGNLTAGAKGAMQLTFKPPTS